MAAVIVPGVPTDPAGAVIRRALGYRACWRRIAGMTGAGMTGQRRADQAFQSALGGVSGHESGLFEFRKTGCGRPQALAAAFVHFTILFKTPLFTLSQKSTTRQRSNNKPASIELLFQLFLARASETKNIRIGV